MSCHPMPAEDWQLLSKLKTAGGLRALSLSDVPGIEKGLIKIKCGDGNRSPEGDQHIRRELERLGLSDIPMHEIKDNGHPLLLHPKAINGAPGRWGTGLDKHFIQSIEEAIDLGMGIVVFLKGHWPCGLALKYGFVIQTYMRALCETKTHVLEQLSQNYPQAIVVAGLHSHRIDAMRTYYVSRSRTFPFLESQGY